MILRWICGVLALCLILFAYLQIEDPDPHVWIPLYLLGAVWPAIAAVAPGRYAARPPLRIAAWLSVALFLGGFLWLAPHIGRDWIHVEEAREAIGFLLCALATLLALWTAGRANRQAYALT